MEWATTIFPIESRVEPSDFVERIWRTHSVAADSMISVAVPHWQIVVVKQADRPASMLVRGPETAASIVGIPRDAEFLGIELKIGTFIPDLAPDTLVDIGKELASTSPSRVHLAGSSWEIPDFENAADFIRHLAKADVLVRDPIVDQTLSRKPVEVTERSVQRRFLRATGLSYGMVRQIERAERTAALLMAGTSILDAVDIAGYSDQAHMTRSLRRFLGKTPGSLSRS
ncbi:helix-turn-helix domain-containing protein [Mesorhizobium sp. NPDC059054]|uniref:AraC family transcriptional regulator n=1 Tax=Mesorhizobium sp. NPDC059054 TaxID=3346711 RepID=UPI0036A38000